MANFFVAEEWQAPSLFFENRNSDDHGWHEFEGIGLTDENADSGPIEDFLIRILIKVN